MKVFIDNEKLCITKWEREKAFYKGANFAEYVDVYFDYADDSYYPAISCTLANRRTIGEFSANDGPTLVDGKYRYRFVLSTDNGQLTVPGSVLITIAVHLNNATVPGGLRRVVCGTIQNTIMETSLHPSGDRNIIIVHEGNEDEVIMDFYNEIFNNINPSINNQGVRIADLEKVGIYLDNYSDLNTMLEAVNTHFTNTTNGRLAYISNTLDNKAYLMFRPRIYENEFIGIELETSVMFKYIRSSTGTWASIQLSIVLPELGAWIENYLEEIGYAEAILDDAKELIDALDKELSARIDKNAEDIAAIPDEANAYADEKFREAIAHCDTNNNKLQEAHDALLEKYTQLVSGAPIDMDSFLEVYNSVKALIAEDSDLRTLIEATITGCSEDFTSTSVSITLNDNSEVTYGDLTSLTVLIPSTVYHGFQSTLVFSVGEVIPLLGFVNNSSYSVIYIKNGRRVVSYNNLIEKNSKEELYVQCDGKHIMIYLREVRLNEIY